MKDIFIDNNVAKNFANPVDPNYKKLIDWLEKSTDNPNNDAFLVVSNKLLREYICSSRECSASTSIPVLIDKLTRDGRLRKFSNKQIKEVSSRVLTKAILKKLKSNCEDHCHIMLVLLSFRKFAITIDGKFYTDLKTFPGYQINVVKKPQDLKYK